MSMPTWRAASTSSVPLRAVTGRPLMVKLTESDGAVGGGCAGGEDVVEPAGALVPPGLVDPAAAAAAGAAEPGAGVCWGLLPCVIWVTRRGRGSLARRCGAGTRRRTA